METTGRQKAGMMFANETQIASYTNFLAEVLGQDVNIAQIRANHGESFDGWNVGNLRLVETEGHLALVYDKKDEKLADEYLNSIKNAMKEKFPGIELEKSPENSNLQELP